MDNLHVQIIGDYAIGSQHIKFATKKLGQLIDVYGYGYTSVVMLNDIKIRLQSGETRNEIQIVVPLPATQPVERPLILAPVTELFLLFFYGMPKEALTVTNATGTFENEYVFCGSGSGNVELQVSNKLIGQYNNCGEPGSIVTGEVTGNTATIVACDKKVYQYTYISHTLFAPFIFRDGLHVISPADKFSVACSSKDYEFRTHTKTVGSPEIGWMTVTAVEHQPGAAYGVFDAYWYLCAKFNGSQVMFDGVSSRTGDTRRDTYNKTPILFDVWEEEGVFYIGRATGLLDIWKCKGRTAEKISSTVLLGLPKGYAKWIYYYFSGDGSRLNTADADGIVKTFTFKDNHEVFTTIWNHFNDTLYVHWGEYYQPITGEAVAFADCSYIEIAYLGTYHHCFHDCSGDITDCVGYYCDNHEWEQICPEPTTGVLSYPLSHFGFNSIDASVALTMAIGPNWETYNYLTILEAPVIATSPTHVIEGFKGNFRGIMKHKEEGEQRITAPIQRRYVLQNDNISHQLPDNGTPHCSGLVKNYELEEFVFTVDGYYAKYKTTAEDCAGGVTTDYVTIGDTNYSKAFSKNPFDYNWSAILKDGSEDTESDPLKAALVYLDGTTEENLFYDIGDGVVDLPGNGNRSFFMAERFVKK